MLDGQVGGVASMLELLPSPLDLTRLGRRPGGTSLLGPTRVTTATDRALGTRSSTSSLRLPLLSLASSTFALALLTLALLTLALLTLTLLTLTLLTLTLLTLTIRRLFLGA